MWYIRGAANDRDSAGAITPTAGNVMPPGMPQPGGPQGSNPNLTQQQQQSGPPAGQTPTGGPAQRGPPQSANTEQGQGPRGGSRSGTPHGQLQRQLSKSEEDGPKTSLRPRSRDGRPGLDDRGHRPRGEHEPASNVHYRDQDRRRDKDRRDRSTSSDRLGRGRDSRYRDSKQYTPERVGDQDPHRPRYDRDRRYSDESIRSNSTDKGERRYPPEMDRYANDTKHGYPNEQYPRNKHRGSRRERYQYDDTKPYPPEEPFCQDDLESLESYSGKEPLSRTSSGRSLDRQRRMYSEPYDTYPGGEGVSMPNDNRERRPRNRRERSSPGNMSRSPPRGPQYENSSGKRTNASPRHSITVEDVDAPPSLVPDAFGARDSNRTEGVPKHHLDPSSAVYKVNKQESPMIRNDSLSSDQSECVRPPPPKPRKPKASRAKQRQFSLSSSEEEIVSTPDYTSPDEGELESESVSERGKSTVIFYIDYLKFIKKRI